MQLINLPLILSLLTLTSALPILHKSASSKPLPLLVWHGLGDRYDADGLHSVGELAEQIHPGTVVHYIQLDDDGSKDRSASFFGNVTTQIDTVCASLQSEPSLLDPATGTIRVDALGFSQGGQFLRGLVQRCAPLSVRSLVTFGSQHNGIVKFQTCGDWDFLCRGAIGLVRSNAWTDYVQSNVVPPQYYRTVDPDTGLGSDEYLEHSNFLADANNERPVKSKLYKSKISALEHFVMYVFEDDETVIPKESGWFAEVNGTSGEVTPLRERPIYKEDWLGLKLLDEKDGLVFATVPGGHMQLDEKDLTKAFKTYYGPEMVKDSGVSSLSAWNRLASWAGVRLWHQEI